jgi:hypothetical protein
VVRKISLTLTVLCSGLVLLAQAPANVGTVLRNVARSFPALTLQSVRQSEVPYQNSWQGSFVGWQIRVDVAGSSGEAEWKLEHSLYTISVGPDRKDTFEGGPVYVWNRYGGCRFSYQTGLYVIHINQQVNQQRDERMARTLLEAVVRELKAAGPKPEVRRARDLSLDSPMAISWGPQRDYFREENFEIVNWEDAMYTMTTIGLRGGKQYHTRWLTVFGVNGEKILLLQPEIDWYVTLAKARNLTLSGFATE